MMAKAVLRQKQYRQGRLAPYTHAHARSPLQRLQLRPDASRRC